jgi:hypothetical protein
MMDWTPTIAALAITDIAKSVGGFSTAIVGTATVMLLATAVAAAITRVRWPRYRVPLFTIIVLIVTVSSALIGAATVLLNVSSPMGGPVQWSAGYQLWACDNQLNLRKPQGLLNNHVGTATLYEQNDNQIHYNGTPTNLPTDASLGKFMQVVGGEISDSSLVIPLDSEDSFVGTPNKPEQLEPYIDTNRDGTHARFVNDQKCGDDKAEVQVFAYKYSPAAKTYYQTKLDHPANYELSHTSTVPPGDCVVIEFATPKDHTDHLCASYGVRDYDRCTQFGVAADKVASCDIREIR